MVCLLMNCVYQAHIAAAQTSLQNHLGPSRVYSVVQCKVSPCSFTVGDEWRREPSWDSFQFPRKVHSHKKSRLIVKAIATLEPKRMAGKEAALSSCNVVLYNDDAKNESVDVKVKSLGEDAENLDAKEVTRRMRISKANKGLTPWNKGRKHSPETIQLIKERTRLAMQDPKVKMKLANLGHAQSEETKLKIAESVRTGWQKRREKQLNQETCYYEWQNLIAEASRNGYAGEDELQWNSYQILNEKLDVEWVESVDCRKATRPKVDRRMKKSPEQRKKIAEAITAKWADPEYRVRVRSGMARFHGTTERAPNKPRRKQSDDAYPRKQTSKKKTNSIASMSSNRDKPNAIQQPKLRRSKGPMYKDPMTSSKLKMIKKIRAQRAAVEKKRTGAIEQARLLIAKAENAANALEVAAATSPTVRASLLESRKLIAEAVKYVESLSGWVIASDKIDSDPTLPNGRVTRTSNDLEAINQGYSLADISSSDRTQHVGSTNEINGDLSFSKFAFQHMLNGNEKLQTSPQISNGFISNTFGLETFVEPQNSLNQLEMLELNGSRSESSPLANVSLAHHLKEDEHSDSVTTTKKWVRGKLVEVSGSS